MSESNASRNVHECPDCGAPLPPNAPDGLCPSCLLRKAAMPTGIESGVSEGIRAQPPNLERLARAFPHLEIVELIGQGGMGCVFKARQPQLNRLVALKVLPEELARDAAFAARFTREAQALAALNHPNIVTVHDFGQSGGFFFLLMEFVDGVNLRQALRAGRFTPEQALAMVPPICEALQFAHERGIVHRDIKPENLLLDRAGRIKIADFGIAKMIGAAPLRGEEKAAGTPQYIAPEQAANPAQADHRADIYSLGVVLYEMLTGELPAQRLEPPSRKVEVDLRIDEVVLRALEKSPALRWQTAAEMQTQVEDIAASHGGGEIQPPARRRELLTVCLLSLPSAVFAWFVLAGHRALMIDLDADLIFWANLVGFPLSGVAGALLAWALGSYSEADRQLAKKTKRWSKLAITSALLVALSVLLMGGGLAILSLAGQESGGWNPGTGELLFTIFFVGGGALTAFAGTLLGAMARKQIRERLAIGWGPASNAAWFWPGVAALLGVLLVPMLLGRQPAVFNARAAENTALLELQRRLANERRTSEAPVDSTDVPLELLAPVAVATYPVSGSTDVPPGRTKLWVRFSKPMLDQSWSWSTAWQESAPQTVSGPVYIDPQTCAITVELEPDRTYAYWLNSERFANFQDRSGHAAVPYLLIFRTGAADASPQPDTREKPK